MSNKASTDWFERSVAQRLPEVVASISTGISLEIQTLEQENGQPTNKHDAGLQLDIYGPDNVLRLIQSPQIELSGAYLAFNIPLDKARAQVAIEQDRCVVQLELDARIDPEAVTGSGSTIEQSIQAVNIRV